jgi:hypothetical protein
MNETESFLGDHSTWGRAEVELHGVHGLYGGVNVLAVGEQVVLLQVVEIGPQGLHEKLYLHRGGEGSSPEASPDDRIFETLVASDFVAIKTSDRLGEPDEVRFEITVSNARGEERTIGAWERSTQGPDSYATSDRKRFDDVHRMLRRLGTVAEKEGEGVREGPHETSSWRELVERYRSGGPVAQLTGCGSIRVSGGCEVFTEGEIHFHPAETGVEVVVENKGDYGYFTTPDGAPLETIRTLWSTDRLGGFLERIRDVLQSKAPPAEVTTRDARVQVLLPLDVESVEADWSELFADRDVDLLLETIEAFVQEIIADGEGDPR